MREVKFRGRVIDGRGKGADGGGRTAEMEAGGMIYTRLHPREDSTRKIFDLGAVV